MPFPTHIVDADGIVEDGQGKIHLVKTRDGGWVYPSGQVEVGENFMDALLNKRIVHHHLKRQNKQALVLLENVNWRELLKWLN